MSQYDGNYSTSIPTFSAINNGTLHVDTETPSNCYYKTSDGTQYNFTPTNQNAGADLKFAITVSGTTYTFNGAFTAAGNGQNAKYAGSVNDGHPNPRAASGTWQATQTTPMPMPAEGRPHEAHKKAV